MLRAKRRRTRTHDKAGNPIFNTMNSTPLQSVYTNKNNNLQQLQNCRCKLCNQDYYFKKSIKIELYGTEDYDPNIVHILGEYELIDSAEMVYFNEIENKYLGFYSSKINDITAIDDATFEPVIGISESYPSANINAVWYVMDVEGNFIKNTDSNIWSMAAIVSNITDNIYSNLVLNTNIVITPFKISLCGCSNCEIKEDDNGNITARCCKGAPQRNPIKGYRKQLLYTGKPVKRNSIELELYGNDGHDIDISNIMGEYIPLVASKVDPIYYNRVSSTYIGFYKSNLSNINNIPGSMFPPIFGIGYNYPSKDTIADWYILDKNGNFISINNDDIWSLAAVKNSISSTINSNLVFANLFDDAISKTINVFCNHPLNEKIQKRALPLNTVYKDNYAKICGAFRKSDVIGLDGKGNIVVTDTKAEKKVLCGYPQVIKRIQNRNGWINDKYNYSHTQYLQRRCRRQEDLTFNFLSNSAIKGSKDAEFLTGCINSIVKSTNTINIEGNNNCFGKCDLSCNNLLALDCTKLECSQEMNNIGNISCAKKGYTVCEATNNNCKAVYKRSNPRFSRQGAVSGGSRINRLKYQTKLKAQSRRMPVTGYDGKNKTSAENKRFGPMSFDNHINNVNGYGGAVNGVYPVSLYRNTYPTYKSNLSGVCLGKTATCNGLRQRCKISICHKEEIKYIQLELYGEGGYDPTLISILGTYMAEPDVKDIYYNKEKGVYLGFYSGNIGQVLNPNNLSQSMALGVGNKLPSSDVIANWYIMDIEGSFINNTDDNIWSMAAVVNSPSDTINSNLILNKNIFITRCNKYE